MRERGLESERESREPDRGLDRTAERDVENKYLLKLEDARDSFAERRMLDMVDRLVPVVGGSLEQIREAWHLWRAKEPQPETHARSDPMQLRLSEDKNLAFASLLRRAGGEPDRDEGAHDAVAPRVGDDDIFARAVRGAAFKRPPQQPQPDNRGERPNIRPEPVRAEAAAERPVRAPLSAQERQHVQAEALEAVARGALERAPARPAETREEYFARKHAELQQEPGRLRPVERDLEKLRKVPGLFDPEVAEREFEKADARYRAADNDDERAKAFTRAMALRLLVEANSRSDTAPNEARPLPSPVASERVEAKTDEVRELDTNPEGGRRKREVVGDAVATVVPVRTLEVGERDVVAEQSRSISREHEDAFRMKDRLRANSEEERLGEAVAHEMYLSQNYWDNSELMAAVRAAELRFEAEPSNADFFVLARQHEALVDDAHARDDDEEHLADRIALAGLAQKQLYAQRSLEYRVAEDAVEELRAAPPWERDEVKREALALMEVEHRGERPFVDDFAFVKRELVRLNDDEPEAARVMAVLHQFMRHSPAVLAEDAAWDAAASARVATEGDRVLLDDAVETDARLQSELTGLRLALLLDPAEAVRAQAMARAQDVALLLQVLPARRSLEIDTGN